MEGYSVTEAASILGVPTERVWELLARGVLSGAPEGETGMRVYLQPRPAPAPPAAEPPRPNGDAEPTRELSPFRELLTEFRNLTERYGQALLALGEARGEVAALRSRVDLLEARMDLRLPMTAGPMTPPTPWPTPMPAAPTPGSVEESALQHDSEEEHADPEHTDEDRRRRRGARRATESFAEALARAEDPTPSELPDAAETAAALAAIREEQTDAGATEAVLPRELPAAEPMPLADEQEPGSVIEAQPEPVQVVEREPEPVPEAPPEALEVTADEGEARGEGEPEAVIEAEPEPVQVAEGEDVPVEAAPAEPEAEPVTSGEPEPEREAVAEAPPDAVAATVAEEPEPDVAPAEPIAWDPERYTVEIVEPDWYAEEPIVSDQPPPSEPEPEPVAGPEREAALSDSAPEPARAEASPEAETPEETMLWFGRTPPETRQEASSAPSAGTGADEMEIVGAQPRSEAAPLPGSDELDDALAALDALGPTAATPDQPVAAAEPIGKDEEEAWPPAVGTEVGSGPPAPDDEPDAPGLAVGSLTSLTRPSATPATRAYRRLRRIFPG
jgi:hypothetical protein